MQTRETPSIASAREAKAQLEQALLAAIRSFEATTGLTVESVDLSQMQRHGRPPETALARVEVRL